MHITRMAHHQKIVNQNKLPLPKDPVTPRQHVDG